MNTVLLASIVAFTWGITPIIHRMVLKHVSHYTVMFISAIVYGILTVLYVYFVGYNDVSKDLRINMRFIPYIFLTTFLGMFLANLLYYQAIKYTDNVNIVNIITALYPLIALVLAYFVLNETLTSYHLLGFFLIMSGIILLFIK
jgi:uncharacterized membrane protein